MRTEFSRRAFLGGAAAMAVWPENLWSAPKSGNPESSSLVSVWERPDGTATDGVMVRRLYLDVTGQLPTIHQAKTYVKSSNPGKRAALVEDLLSSDSFADYWTMRFCDILRVKSEFPINLWPNAVYVYHNRVRKFVEQNETWESFGRSLLVSQGSNFRDAEVNFFRATDKRSPTGWAEAVAQTFLGIKPSNLSDSLRKEFAEYFSNLRLKNTREWKEEIVFVDGHDRRGELCDRLFRLNRDAVAVAFAMRVREWIFGPSARNAPVKAARICGLKDMLREVLLSSEYARGSVTGGFPVRRLDAETLDDAFCSIHDSKRDYQSPAPEPFTFIPPKRNTVCIEDGSISNGFLSLFGRPARDTGLMAERGTDVTAKQRLYLYNSGSLNFRISRLAMPPYRLPGGKIHPFHLAKHADRVNQIYWRFLSRAASPQEQTVIADEWSSRRNRGKNEKSRYGVLMRDVAWSIINSKEFIFRT